MVLWSECRRKGSLPFLFLLTVLFILLVNLPDSVESASLQFSQIASPRRSLARSYPDRFKKSSHLSTPSSLARRRDWKTLPATTAAVNTSRNARQVPEIPALYSAPKIQTPEIPALYSAPKSPEQDGQQNELEDQQAKATTEVVIGEEEEEDDETSSEDYQYLPPTEKYPRMMSGAAGGGGDPNQEEGESPNDYPTDSPIPQATYLPPVSRTNDVEFDDDNDENNDETTEDSYNSSGGHDDEPSPQYGPPQASNGENGNGASKRKMQDSSLPSRGSVGNNRRPSDQQQIENSEQPMTRQHQNSGSDSEPKPGYLPPVYQPPLPQKKQQPSNQGPAKRPEQNSPEEQNNFANNDYNRNPGNDYGQQPPNPGYQTLPQQPEDAPSSLQDLDQENGRSPAQQHQQQQPQGQYFGNNHQQQQQEPSSFYGPPTSFHQEQQSTSPNNGNRIVNAIRGGGNEEEELEGLNEKIVDAELLDRVQQIIEDHERQQKEFLDKIQKENENAIFSPSSPQGYDSSGGAPGDFTPFSGNELSSTTGGGDREHRPFYGPPPPSNNGYSNPNSGGQPAGAYLPPSSPGNLRTSGLSSEVQVQKAVLSQHFTETEPGPVSGYRRAGKTATDNRGYKPVNQLNSVAGPGPEYLPPSSRNLENPGYSSQSANSASGKDGGYGVKVGAGITVADNNNHAGPQLTSGGSSNPSLVYGPPQIVSSSTSGSSQASRDFHAQRQGGGSSSPRALERFPVEQPSQYQAPSQFWSRSQAGASSPETSNNQAGSYNQRSSNPQQAAAPSPDQYLPPSHGNNAMIAVPRPVYGVPLAPVITLDSDNNLQNNFNNNNRNPGGGSQGATTNSGVTSNYYLPPAPALSSSSSQPVEIGQYQAGVADSLSNPFNLPQHDLPGEAASPEDDSSYGFLSSSSHPSSPSSASSTYLMIQGHNGNSNNHIYNINHNGFDDTTSDIGGGSRSSFSLPQYQHSHPFAVVDSSSYYSDSGATMATSSNELVQNYDSSSIMIPGISNTFALPIYDYSPSHQNLVHDPLLGSATAPVGLSFEQLLQQQQQPYPNNILTLPENFPAALFYDTGANRRQDNFRVNRRAISTRASISPVSFGSLGTQQPSSLSTAPGAAVATKTTKTTTHKSQNGNGHGSGVNGRQGRNRGRNI